MDSETIAASSRLVAVHTWLVLMYKWHDSDLQAGHVACTHVEEVAPARPAAPQTQLGHPLTQHRRDIIALTRRAHARHSHRPSYIRHMTEGATLRTRIYGAYERHAKVWDAAFFAGGFVFDVVATSHGVDHPLLIVQQVVYLGVIGGILYVDVLREARPEDTTFPPRLERLWSYRSLVVHFCLGTLMNLYSIFFLMSASPFSSVAFVALLSGAIVANELEAVRRRGVDVKVGLFAICVFCFWSLMIPIVVGRVGLLPFVGSFIGTLGSVAAFYALLRRRLTATELSLRLAMPAISVSLCFLVLYLIGLIPPVPIAAKRLGVYHRVEKVGNDYLLSHEPVGWRFWQKGDQTFVARPGDKIYVFVAVFSPARFDDTVFVRWELRDRRGEWTVADRLPLHITGGRRDGFRGFVNKERYSEGDWRLTLETRDRREISRLYFTVTRANPDPARVFVADRS